MKADAELPVSQVFVNILEAVESDQWPNNDVEKFTIIVKEKQEL